MPRIRTDQPVLPSLLDRLIDDDPQRSVEEVKSFSALLSDIKSNIRRDLENLLNTRLYRQNSIDHLSELNLSLANYGVSDFSHVQFESEDERLNFAWRVSDIIRKFEPRFERVFVEIEPLGEEFERSLYLKINAILLVEPDPVPLIFDSRIRTADRALRLRELKHG
ncbi:MAG: type VI secretion system baseplate subunit TssE [Cellvibrionaceae bacterium]